MPFACPGGPMRVPRLHPRLTRARVAWVVFLLAGTLAVAGALRLAGGPGDDATLSGEGSPTGDATGIPTDEPTDVPTDGPTSGDPTVPTFFTVSSFNVLGAGHTSPNGNKK